MKQFIVRHKWLTGITLGLFLAASTFILFSNVYVGSYGKYILHGDPDKIFGSPALSPIGIVFGSGITKEGKPYKELQGRLDGAAEALKQQKVMVLLLTGDNRFKNYDEPTAMKNYLVNEKHVDPQKLVLDFAGRSTYESCERAAKIFQVDFGLNVLLFSAPSHLPRAIFTCRKFGIKAYGVAAGGDANNAGRREFLARTKAMFNVYIKGERTILGEPMPIIRPL